jgi:hypothetical protein
MHRQSLIIEMQKPRRSIEIDIPTGSAIMESRQAIRPWMEQRDTGGAPLPGRDFEIVHASQDFHTAVAERRTEHAAAG